LYQVHHKNMTDENSTANQTTISSTGEAASDAFFDPSWPLLLAVQFYFQYAVIAVGIFGAITNALVLYALIAQHVRAVKKRLINLPIINQNLLDLTCCILLVISICIQNSSIYVMGAFGYFVCTIFINNTAAHCVLYGSITNLVALTVERYLKVVHPFWSKKNLKRWMVYAQMAFTWIVGIVFAGPVSFITARVEDGLCTAYYELPGSQWILWSCNMVLFFIFPLIAFIYCYGRIVVVMKRQMRVMAGHNPEGSTQMNASKAQSTCHNPEGSTQMNESKVQSTGHNPEGSTQMNASTAQSTRHNPEGSTQMNASKAQSKRLKYNIIKTMIIVSVAFIACWFPHNIYFLILTYSEPSVYLIVGYYLMVFLVYLNVCMNPFIYATKHEGVKHQLARLVFCRKATEVGDSSGSSGRPIRTDGTHPSHVGVTHR